MHFPLPFMPERHYVGGLGFDADRSAVAKKLGTIPGNVLRHGACDLVAPAGTPVLAIDDGRVLRGPYPFFLGTYAIEVQHTNFIARYCEVAPRTEVRKHDPVFAGQVIGYVGNQPGGDMLHLELFSGALTGDLTTAKTVANRPYYRRGDLMDPTALLDSLRDRLPVKTKGWKVVNGQQGYKVLEYKHLSLLDI
jgi:murein DD-endopeptidase MepM/ murein hydrolase activator NlpD